jgi:hypothetical protein
MTQTNDARALKGATAARRDRRRPQGERRPAVAAAWVRPLRRANRVLNASVRLLTAGLATAARSERSARRQPIRSSQNLEHAGARLALASSRLGRVVKELVETTACLQREPETAAGAPELLMAVTQRWIDMAQALGQASGDVFALHEDLLEGLTSGALVPERSDRRPRIILAPRPTLVRAFLTARQPRVADRISALLNRRRRAPRPSAVKVPRCTSQGRAPPSFDLPALSTGKC